MSDNHNRVRVKNPDGSVETFNSVIFYKKAICPETGDRGVALQQHTEEDGHTTQFIAGGELINAVDMDTPFPYTDEFGEYINIDAENSDQITLTVPKTALQTVLKRANIEYGEFQAINATSPSSLEKINQALTTVEKAAARAEHGEKA
jgi:hypothetical protein